MNHDDPRRIGIEYLKAGCTSQYPQGTISFLDPEPRTTPPNVRPQSICFIQYPRICSRRYVLANGQPHGHRISSVIHRSIRGRSYSWTSVSHSNIMDEILFAKVRLFRNYVNAATAASLNLTYASGDTFILRADSTTVLSASGPGRNSVRIQSNKAYTNSVMM